MTQLMRAINLKRGSDPVGFSRTPVLLAEDKALFPYPNHWRGDYRSPYPMIEKRRAGYRPRVTFDYERPSGILFGLADGCFETAPSTTFPCWEVGYGCQTPACKTNCDPDRSCVSRVDFR
jgi:hypothetical protein